MVSIAALILPIVVATALVWVAAALVWTVLPWHKRTFRALPDEAGALSALRTQALAPGQYDFPHITSPRDMREPQLRRQLETGPAGFITVRPPGVPAMGKAMALSGIFYLLVSVAVAYLASRTLAAGAGLYGRVQDHRNRRLDGLRRGRHTRSHLVRPAVERYRQDAAGRFHLRDADGRCVQRAVAGGLTG